MTIQEFDQEQKFLLPNNDITSLRCIDDRYSEKDGPLANYAVPGAGLGLITDVFSGFEKVLSNLTKDQIITVFEAAKSVIGKPTFHTGHGKIASPVAGCGYCVDSVEGTTHISPEAAAFLKAFATEAVANGYQPVDFGDIKHDASFVIFVDDYDTGVMPTAVDGTRAYVVHRKVQTDLLTQIAKAAYAALGDMEQNEDVFVDAVLNAAKDRFGEVAGSLSAKGGLKATDVPQYVLSVDAEPELVFDPEQVMA